MLASYSGLVVGAVGYMATDIQSLKICKKNYFSFPKCDFVTKLPEARKVAGFSAKWPTSTVGFPDSPFKNQAIVLISQASPAASLVLLYKSTKSFGTVFLQ
jgi:hypothetical protein